MSNEKKVVKLTAREAKIVELAKAGRTYKEIVFELDLPSHVTVYQALSKAGMTKPRKGGTPGGVTDAERRKVIEMRKAGATYMDIAKAMDWQPPKVNRVLREAGMTRPPRNASYDVEIDG